jgi:tetratricopeptide (TPR) repeat protein
MTKEVRMTNACLAAFLLLPAQFVFGDSSPNARGSGLPVVAPRSLAMQASIISAAFGATGLAQDTVHLANGGSTRGRVVDYTGRELQLELAGGVQRAIPAEQIVRIDTTFTREQTAAAAAFAQRRIESAAALYQEARRIETRGWVRRQITAELVWCYRALGQTERACAEFGVLVQSDPETPYFDCIPLAWIPAPPPVLLEQSARKWMQSDKVPSAVLLGASYLLSTAARPQAMARLKQLTTHSDRRVALLALAQTWRTEVATADEATLAAWRNTIETMPEPLRAGPYYVLGLGRRQRAQWEQAALALLRIPLLYREHHQLASQSLWEAGQLLEKLDQSDAAARLYRELIREYPQTSPVSQAESRLGELATIRQSTGR